MAELRMTPARLALLRAVAAPKVEVYAVVPTRGGWDSADVYLRPWGERERLVTVVAERLESAGLIVRAGVGEHFYAARPYALTPAGESVLAQHDDTTKEN